MDSDMSVGKNSMSRESIPTSSFKNKTKPSPGMQEELFFYTPLRQNQSYILMNLFPSSKEWK